ncbi:hypothetical protein BGX26_011999 [Mortierella sp. AD094]|nr:hypothetical protein BGX26_011999 [Mortierella sp. AD094]
MATSRSHVKRRFTPYQSIANTFEAKVNRQRLLLARRNKEAIATLGQEYNFWSQLSDEALFSIVQQACSKDQGSDDTVESSTLQYSMDPSLHEITEAFAGKCSVNRSPDEIIALFSRQCSLQTPGSTSVHKTPNRLAVTFARQCSLTDKSNDMPVFGLTNYTHSDFWSHLSDEEIFSISQQAYSMDKTPDDTTESVTIHTPGPPIPMHELSNAPSQKNHLGFPLIKDLPELRGLDQSTIVHQTLFKMNTRIRSIVRRQFTSSLNGDVEECRRLSLRLSTIAENSVILRIWRCRNLTSEGKNA